MGLFDDNLDHLAPLGLGEGSLGPTAGFIENFGAASEQQFRVDSMFAVQSELSDRFFATRQKAAELSGDQFDVDEAALMPWVRKQKGVEAFSSKDPWRPGQNKETMLSSMESFNARLHEMKKQGFDVQTLEDILAEVEEMRAQVMGESESAWERASLGGMAGAFLGSMWGSLSFERDPVLVGSLVLGGGGRLLATRLLSEFAVGAAAEGVQQFAGIRPQRELLGEEQTNPWFDIIVGGTLGAGFRGAGELAAPTFRAVERRIAPQRAEARRLRDLVDVEEAPIPLREATNEELLGALDRQPQTPKVRAAREALLRDIELDEINPFGSGRTAHGLAARSIGEEAAIALGRQTDTAVGRFLPEQAVELGKTPDPAVAIARERAPELYRALDAADLRVREAEAEIAALEDARTSRRVSDAIDLIDPETGARVRQIEEELDGPVPRSRRRALEEELDLIVETLGREQIERTEADAAIGPRRQQQATQRSRQAARKEWRRLQKLTKQVEDRVLAEMEAKTRIEALRAPKPAPDALAERLTHMAEQRDTYSEGIKQRALGEGEEPATFPENATSPEPTPIPPDMIDLGTDDLVPAEFEAFIDADGTSLSARAIFEDMREDDRMIEAMKRCSI